LLRKLHFLVDFCWNIEIYRPLLSLGHLYGTNPIDTMIGLITSDKLADFFADFDTISRQEWFENPEAIEDYFAESKNWERLLNLEFEKMNIQFTIIALRDYKAAFDLAIMQILESKMNIPQDVLAEAAKLTFALFPALEEALSVETITVAANLTELNFITVNQFVLDNARVEIQLQESGPRVNLRSTIASNHASTLSKILNTQGISLRDLRLSVSDNFRFDNAFRRETTGVFPKQIKIQPVSVA